MLYLNQAKFDISEMNPYNMKNKMFVLGVLMLLLSFSVKAQEKWSMEFRPALNFPTSDMGQIDSKIGFGFELLGAYNLMPHLAIYAGWGLNQFKGESDYSADNLSFEERGYTFGFQIIRPIGTSAFSYFARAGTVYNLIKLENNTRDIHQRTNHGFGWQVEFGVDYEFAYNLSVRPSLRYRSLSRNFEVTNVSTDFKLNYISFGVGLTWEFDF